MYPSLSFHSDQLRSILFHLYPFRIPCYFKAHPIHQIISSVNISAYISKRDHHNILIPLLYLIRCKKTSSISPTISQCLKVEPIGFSDRLDLRSRENDESRITKIWVLPIGRIVFTLTEMGKAMERARLVGGMDKEFGFRHSVFCDLGLAIGTNHGLSQNALSFSTESSERKVMQGCYSGCSGGHPSSFYFIVLLSPKHLTSCDVRWKVELHRDSHRRESEKEKQSGCPFL